MSHIDKINDKDPCFEVDPITRAIKNVSSTKTTLMQFDHNSERFTFTLPRYIEGHDMSEATKAEVHYLNVDVAGVYPMNDIAVDEENESKIKCTWLISRNATMKPGALHFLLRFVCLSSGNTVEYAWHTEIHKGILVSAGMNNLADVTEDGENDILAQWKAELFAEFGEDNKTGLLGYYVKSINLNEKKIYLSKEKVTPEIVKNEACDETFETPAYAVGNEFSLILPIVANGRDHFNFIGKISAIQNNEVLCDIESFPFTALYDDAAPFSPIFFVPSQPEIGIVDIGGFSFAVGEGNIAAGKWSYAEGFGNIAGSRFAHAEGCETKAGYAAHSEGQETKAIGHASHSEGYDTSATGKYAHSEGRSTTASGGSAHAEGSRTISSGMSAHAEGDGCISTGQSSHAEGQTSQATGNYGSHAEGFSSKANGIAAHAENRATQANGDYSHSEGEYSIAAAMGSHAEGKSTQALAGADYSHVEGDHTISRCPAQHVQGKYNEQDYEHKYAHIVGNGTSAKRSNAHTLDWEGNAWFARDVVAGNVSVVKLMQMIESLHYYGNKDAVANITLTVHDVELYEGYYVAYTLFALFDNGEMPSTLILPISCDGDVYDGGISEGYEDYKKVKKIIIPRGCSFYDNDTLKKAFVNLKTIIRIDEDGVVTATEV